MIPSRGVPDVAAYYDGSDAGLVAGHELVYVVIVGDEVVGSGDLTG